MNKLLSFHADPAVKEKYLSRVRAHAKADEIIKGQYWEGGKGCAVGCTIHGSNHVAYENELGLPQWLAYLEDSIFEGLPNEEAMTFPEEFLSSINVGSDLTLVYNKFMHWLLVDPVNGVLKYTDESGAVAIKSVAELHCAVIEGQVVTAATSDAASDAAWAAARAAAGDAASAAASAAARAAASDAASDAAGAAASDAAGAAAVAAAGAATRAAAWAAAGDAAWAAAVAAAWDAAWAAARIAQRNKLLELLLSA